MLRHLISSKAVISSDRYYSCASGLVRSCSDTTMVKQKGMKYQELWKRALQSCFTLFFTDQTKKWRTVGKSEENNAIWGKKMAYLLTALPAQGTFLTDTICRRHLLELRASCSSQHSDCPKGIFLGSYLFLSICLIILTVI